MPAISDSAHYVSAFCDEIKEMALAVDKEKSDLYSAICDAIIRLEGMVIEYARYSDTLVDLLKMAVGPSRDDTYDLVYAAIKQHEMRRGNKVD